MSDTTAGMNADEEATALAEAQRILAEREWPFTLELAVPVQFGKETIEALVFQRGTFGVLKGMEVDRAPNVDDLIVMAARLCGRSPKVIELLDPIDADEVITIALNFFGRCRGAGRRLSAT